MSRDLKGKAEMPPSSGRVTGKDTREAVTRRRHARPDFFFAGNKGIPPLPHRLVSQMQKIFCEDSRQQQLSPLPAFAPAHVSRLHASL